MKLNDKQCKNAKPNSQPSKTPRKLSDGEGLSLWVMPDESKYWRLAYRFNGKQKTLALGVYPETSLKEARDAKLAARKLLREGKDPSLERKKTKILSDQKHTNTFETIALEWMDKRKGAITPVHAKTTLERLRKDVFSEIGSYPIVDITPPMLLEVIRKVESRGAHDIAQRNLQSCGQIFRYAIQTGRAERDVAADLRGALAAYTKNHYACIDLKELPDLLRAIDVNKARLYPQTILATKLLILTFVRTGELIGAKWEEFDLDNAEWAIPAERMKMRRPHIVPLSKQAIAILEELKPYSNQWGWVFPSQVRPRQHMSNGTILGVFRRLGYKGRMTGHGCRALAMTAIKEKLGYRHEVVDRQLAHAHRNKIDAAYDRADFLDERKVMMQEWADYLDSAQ